MGFSFTFSFILKITIVVFIIAVIVTAYYTLPIEKMLKAFLLWVEQDLGPWGPLVLVVAYVPLTILAVPASILTLGGGYLFGLPMGIVADCVGSTIGAVAAFVLGRTVGRSYIISRLKDYPQFKAVAIAIQRSGFKIVLLLRLAPLVPFNMLNYLLSITPVSLGKYTLASWLGMMPITVALVYVGTTLKDLSDVTRGWNALSKTRCAFIVFSLVVSVLLMIGATRVAKDSLQKALAESEHVESIDSPRSPIQADSPEHQRLIVRTDSSPRKS